MDRHPIENIMTTTMENIRDMIDVNTVIGDAIETEDGTTVVPVSRVCFGFVAGGGEYGQPAPSKTNPDIKSPQFGGGTGAGVTVQPVGFIVTNQGQVRLLPAQHYSPVDRVIEMLPQVMTEIKNAICKCAENKKECNSAQIKVDQAQQCSAQPMPED